MRRICNCRVVVTYNSIIRINSLTHHLKVPGERPDLKAQRENKKYKREKERRERKTRDENKRRK